MFDQARAEHVIQFVELLKHTKSPFNGVPFTVLPWQRTILADVYGTMNASGIRQYRYAYLEIPKKQGKSELVAALALYHMFADREVNGEVYGCAGDREQASLVFDVAVDMIDQLPTLKKRCKLNLSMKQITDKKTGTFYKVMSSEAYTKHGLNLSACIFDELHVQPNRDLWDVMTKGAGDARTQPLWWIITTAGDDPDRLSIGWEVHERATEIIHARDVGDATHDIPTWYPVIYNYEGEDIYNEANWMKSNPSLGVTVQIDKMREAAEEAKRSKADERLFRWLRLNQWVTTKLSGWLPLDLFDSTMGAWSRADLIGRECYMGMDMSTTTDLSAICLVFPPQQWQEKVGDELVTREFTKTRVIWDCWIPEETMQDRIRTDHVPYDVWAAEGWIHATKGNWIDYIAIKARILEANSLYKVKEIAADLSFATMLIQELQEEGMTVIDIPQQYTSLTDPMNLIETKLGTKEMEHEAHPVARWCFGNTSISKNGNAQIKYVKERKGKRLVQSKRIDLTVAWVCAMARAKLHDTGRSVYEKRGMLTL